MMLAMVSYIQWLQVSLLLSVSVLGTMVDDGSAKQSKAITLILAG